VTLEEYVKWLEDKGVKPDDTIIFAQDDGSGYGLEVSDVPIIEGFKNCTNFKGLRWDSNPKWILGTGTT
jgi:hypothetical protein